MQKSRLGISVGLLGAAMFLACFFGGVTASILLGGYILLFEENAWLKKTAVKAIALLFILELLSAVIYLIPNAITMIDDICRLFDGEFYLDYIPEIVSVLSSALVVLEKCLFITLIVKALGQSTIKIPVVDTLVDKYMD